MTPLILAILDSNAKLLVALIGSQTPAQQAIMWQRYLDLTEPLHRLLVRIEHLGAGDAQPEKVAPAPIAANATSRT
jgi:hypothetical protein